MTGRDRALPALAAAAIAATLLGVVQTRVRLKMLLAERYLPGAGWIEIALLAAWAAFLAWRMLSIRDAPRWRARLWSLFSIVFFGQLAFGLAGLERMLMTGKLHLPVPALIVGGPLFRGEGLFMPILFVSTVLLVGPAWCSHLCYIGAWDNGCSRLARRTPLPAIAFGGGGRRRIGRWATLALVVAAALSLRLAGAPGTVAAACGAVFGLVGVALMVWWSRRTGLMAHCAWYCPIGLLSTRLGKINPWRVRVTEGCTRCGACSLACRYDALTKADVEAGGPNASCTLCGDCLAACRHNSLEYRFPGLSPAASRAAFIAVVVALHATFLGVARL